MTTKNTVPRGAGGGGPSRRDTSGWSLTMFKRIVFRTGRPITVATDGTRRSAVI